MINNNDERYEQLQGYIEHRLQFSANKKLEKHVGCKRKLGDTNNDHDEHLDDSSDNDVGFFFVKERNCHEKSKGIRLISPDSMTKVVCDVARLGSKIVLHNYSIVKWTDKNCRGRKDKINFIRLHYGGLIVESDQSLAELEARKCKITELLSLVDVQKFEKNIGKESKREKGGKKVGSEGFSPNCFHFYGTVDAVSSIITVVPSDPFAFLEIFDSNQPTISATLIIKGREALCCHPGIIPGDNIIFHNVTRIKWHVPKSFQKYPDRFLNRAPTHVFVATDPFSIIWNSHELYTTTLKNNNDGYSLSLPPSTIDSLFCIKGIVTFIQYSTMTQSLKSMRAVNFVILKNVEDESCPKYYKLYLTYYPMQPNLYFGMEIGELSQLYYLKIC